MMQDNKFSSGDKNQDDWLFPKEIVKLTLVSGGVLALAGLAANEAMKPIDEAFERFEPSGLSIRPSEGQGQQAASSELNGSRRSVSIEDLKNTLVKLPDLPPLLEP